jgi:hypothetical protein
MPKKLKQIKNKKSKKNNNMSNISQVVKINLTQPITKTKTKKSRSNLNRQQTKTVRDTQPIIIRQEPFRYTNYPQQDKHFETSNFDHLLAQQLDKFYNEKIKTKDNNLFNRPGAFLAGDDGLGRSEVIEQLDKTKNKNTKDDLYIPSYTEIQAIKRGRGRPRKDTITLNTVNEEVDKPNKKNIIILDTLNEEVEKQQKKDAVVKNALKFKQNNDLINKIDDKFDSSKLLKKNNDNYMMPQFYFNDNNNNNDEGYFSDYGSMPDLEGDPFIDSDNEKLIDDPFIDSDNEKLIDKSPLIDEPILIDTVEIKKKTNVGRKPLTEEQIQERKKISEQKKQERKKISEQKKQEKAEQKEQKKQELIKNREHMIQQKLLRIKNTKND